MINLQSQAAQLKSRSVIWGCAALTFPVPKEFDDADDRAAICPTLLRSILGVIRFLEQVRGS